MDVKIFKLLNGEELIAELDREEGGVLFLRKPLGLGMQVDHERQKQTLVFVPYMPYSSATEEVVIPASSLLMEPLTPVDSLANDYAEATGGIIAPRRTLIRPV